MPTPRLSRRSRERLFKLMVLLIIIPLALLFIAPFYWMLSTSLKDPRFVYLFPPQWIPNPFRFDNYAAFSPPCPSGLCVELDQDPPRWH